MKLKNAAILGRGPTHPEFTAGANIAELKFHDQVVIPFDNGDGKIWFTAEQLAKLLGYADVKQVNKIFQRHKEEFTESMTTLTKVTVSNKNNELEYVQIRLFSLRGAHLIGMLSRTKIAKELRIWLLDLAEQETQPQALDLANLSFASLKDLSVKQITDFLVKAEEYSKRENGTKGSMKMHRRKKEKKAIENADRAAKQFIFFTLGLEFSDGEVCK
ncbi:BRO-N domain-containing protein [Serratia marcescens]|uniref:BRO-N domain-containing protein n=1 Tax=Serratia marcescens TaxID=615 RepID=UPI0009A4E0D1|nr:BRO family protein [Serratia marcescens]